MNNTIGRDVLPGMVCRVSAMWGDVNGRLDNGSLSNTGDARVESARVWKTRRRVVELGHDFYECLR